MVDGTNLYHCPECGWVGDERDLEYTESENINICPRCHEWYNIFVSPDIIKKENE